MKLADLIIDLQYRGLRVNAPFERRPGGAGPSDAGMIWIEGTAVTVPVDAGFVAGSPYTLEPEDAGFGIYADGVRLAAAAPADRPRFYDLATADGIPYWQLALMHLDSLASTVLQTCAYWGNDDQCRFCGIGVSLASGNTVTAVAAALRTAAKTTTAATARIVVRSMRRPRAQLGSMPCGEPNQGV